MSIKEYIIEVVLNSSNIQHYEKLGYDIPRRLDKKGRLTVKKGTKIKVFVFDLPKGSGVKITAICECPTCPNPERILSFYKYTNICKYCFSHSEEHKIKNTGKNSPRFGKGSYLKGKSYEESYGDEKAKELIEKKSGKNHPNWNPNLTDEEREYDRTKDKKFKKWSREVKERDNFKCIVPGCTNTHLESHHLDNWIGFPEKRYDLNNGITLCKDHHRGANGYSYHTKFGIKGNIKEQFYQWLLQKLDFENTIL